MSNLKKLNLQGGVPTIISSGTYELVANEPDINNSVIIQVDSSVIIGAVNIILPDSSVFEDGQSPIIYVMDIGGNINQCPITISSASVLPPIPLIPDLINGSLSVNLNADFGVCKISCMIFKVWLALGNVSDEGTGTTGEYRFSQFADTIIPKTTFNETTIGKVFDVDPFVKPVTYFYDTLENGTNMVVYYSQSVLKSGVMIFEAYEQLDPTVIYPIGYIDGWWVAYKQDPTDATKLIKCGELKMTQQFWDNWYSWTAKDSGDNVVKFIETNYPNELTLLETFTTTLTYTGTGLTAVDSTFNYGGTTARSLYESLTGLIPTFMNIIADYPEYILDDDYYGMAMGSEAGWLFYRNNSPDLNVDMYYIVGFNVLTGLTKAFNIVPALSTLTNWTTALLPINDVNVYRLVNHPNGIFATLNDGRLCNNGDNYDGVTAIWSPYWTGANTEVIYLGVRNQDNAQRYLVNGDIGFGNWYWDNVALYFLMFASPNNDWGFICYKYNTNTKETTLYEVPFLTPLNDINGGLGLMWMWANNDGMFINYPSNSQTMSVALYQYCKHEDSILYSFHLDTTHPTHAFNDKIYNIWNFATRNMNTLAVPISTYKNMKF